MCVCVCVCPDKLKEWWSSHGLSKPAARVNKEVHDELKALQEQVKDKDSLLLQKDSDLSKMKVRVQWNPLNNVTFGTS